MTEQEWVEFVVQSERALWELSWQVFVKSCDGYPEMTPKVIAGIREWHDEQVEDRIAARRAEHDAAFRRFMQVATGTVR